ncbi:MAG: hypothetical protein KBC72_00430 [Acinetobacter sp.]|nr:hypothetical protein [Acinetobacter sp.]
MHTITIPLKIPSLNEILRTHWSASRKLKKQWRFFFPYWTHETFSHVTITCHRPRLLDYDNFVGGCKSLVVDNFKDAGYIKDDSLKHVSITYEQVQSSKEKIVIIFENKV